MAENSNSDFSLADANTGWPKATNNVRHDIVITGLAFMALIDTGSSGSFIEKSISRTWNLKVDPSDKPVTLLATNCGIVKLLLLAATKRN